MGKMEKMIEMNINEMKEIISMLEIAEISEMKPK